MYSTKLFLSLLEEKTKKPCSITLNKNTFIVTIGNKQIPLSDNNLNIPIEVLLKVCTA